MSKNGLNEVLDLAAIGMRIIPLHPRNKRPIPSEWQLKATTNERTIRTWAVTNKECNWGLATGEGSGVFVVDIDPKAGGDKSWEQLLKKHKIPETVQCRTGSGGIHYYFKLPKTKDIRNSASSVGKGIDIRGSGGQVVIPPSIHPNGTAYEWISGFGPSNVAVAKAPAWLLKLIGTAEEEQYSVEIGEPMERGTRNDQIYHRSLQLARVGSVQTFTAQSMIDWCKKTGEDLSEDEIRSTVASAYKYQAAEEDRKKVAEQFEQSDKGNALQLIDEFGDVIIYVPKIGFHIWNGKAWAVDVESLKVQHLALKAMDTLKVEIADQLRSARDNKEAKTLFSILKHAVRSSNQQKLVSMTAVAKARPDICKSIDLLDDARTTHMLNVGNGILDLVTGKVKPHDPSMLITRLCQTKYNPKAKCPTWLQTMNLAFDGNKGLIKYMQRALGYSLSADTSEQCFFICYGAMGNNGKSTIFEGFRAVLGSDYYMTSDAKTISSGEKADAQVRSSLAAMRKIRVVAVNEISASANLSEELIKQLTGGDEIEARFLYKEVFNYVPVFKIWVRANNKPGVKDIGEAFWRRVKMIPFDKPIPEEKRKRSSVVLQSLRDESEGILAWAVKGFQDWHTNGLQDPPEVKRATLEYREASDIVAQFLGESVEEKAEATVPRNTLYQAYRRWSDQQGYRFPMTNEKFSRRIAIILEQHERVRKGNVAIWEHIKLTDIMSDMIQ
jgi:putative DNA primase/helicase